MEPEITYQFDMTGVDWVAMKRLVAEDDFDNGRTPEQLQRSFENSAVSCVAYAGDQIIGTVRALSDGVCNAYIVDVWTYTPYRHRGVARQMMNQVLKRLPGQHVYLFTDTAEGLYAKLGFSRQGIGMSRVVGTWLQSPG
jgi:ribosomal protein S18 acetylase RimI-like enzyme